MLLGSNPFSRPIPSDDPIKDLEDSSVLSASSDLMQLAASRESSSSQMTTVLHHTQRQ